MHATTTFAPSAPVQTATVTHSVWRTSIRFTLLATLLFGIGYPLVVTGIAGVMFPHKAAGSLILKNGQVIGLVELTIGGLMSTEAADVVARKANTILSGFRACGCNLNNPNMQLSLLGLVVIPDLRISDKGLVDVNHFRILPVIE